METITNKIESLGIKDIFKFYYISFLNKNDNYILNKDGIYLSNNKELYLYKKQLNVLKNNIKQLKEKIDITYLEKQELISLELEEKRKKRKRSIIKTNNNEDKLIIKYEMFVKIVNSFNTKAIQEVINGNTLELSKKLGYIHAQRIERNHATKAVNWNATNKLRNSEGKLPLNLEGKTKLCYFTEDDWLKINWKRTNSPVKNITYYKYIPSDGQVGKGFKNKFIDQNNANINLRLNYEYVPYIHKDNISDVIVYWQEKNINVTVKKAASIIKKEYNDKRKDNTIMQYIVRNCKGQEISGFPFNFKFNHDI